MDTACACTVLRPDFGIGAPEAPAAVALQHAGGERLPTKGITREPALHTGKVVLAAKGVVAEVGQNLLCAHAYVGPRGDFGSWLHGDNLHMIPKERFSKEVAQIDGIVAKIVATGLPVPMR